MLTARKRHGRLDILVNDIFGGDRYAQWDKKLWEHDLEAGLLMLRMGIETHLTTCAMALPLMLQNGGGLVVEMTDGTSEHNKAFRHGVGFYYDLVKASVERITIGLAAELEDKQCTALAVTPGWLRSERMLENFGVSEENWRDALQEEPHFCISESPTFVARGVAALAADPGVDRYAGKVLSSAELARTYGVTDSSGAGPHTPVEQHISGSNTFTLIANASSAVATLSAAAARVTAADRNQLDRLSTFKLRCEVVDLRHRLQAHSARDLHRRRPKRHSARAPRCCPTTFQST